MIVPVLLAGGSGNRLWPLSRELFPKQCLNLVEPDLSLIQKTLQRLVDGCGLTQRPLIVCNNDHRFLIAQQVKELGIECDIILEPAARNTAPAIALAAHYIQNTYGHLSDVNTSVQMLVLPADHLIQNEQAFAVAIATGSECAANGKLVTFGVTPSYPETGYGYIEAESLGCVSGIKAFHEKPELERAQQYLASGRYYWNSGIFLFPVATLLGELKRLQPEVHEQTLQSVKASYTDLDFIRAEESTFKRSPSISIDVAIMENTAEGMVVPYQGDWSDIGSWDAVRDALPRDEQGNAVRGDALLRDTSDSLIFSTSRLVGAIGLKNVAIVDTEDALLVMNLECGQAVKALVADIKDAGRHEHRRHSLVHRPWGSVEMMNIGPNYQVKHVMVNPGASIAMQVHKHRAEHWVVVAGKAEVSIAEKVTVLGVNQSLYIEAGDVHSLRNLSGIDPLEIIEVQTGDYFGDDDVLRFTNNYVEAPDL